MKYIQLAPKNCDNIESGIPDNFQLYCLCTLIQKTFLSMIYITGQNLHDPLNKWSQLVNQLLLNKLNCNKTTLNLVLFSTKEDGVCQAEVMKLFSATMQFMRCMSCLFRAMVFRLNVFFFLHSCQNDKNSFCPVSKYLCKYLSHSLFFFSVFAFLILQSCWSKA